MQNPSQELTFVMDLAREAAPIFTKYFGAAHTEWKEDNTPVTPGDVEINDFIIRKINEVYPNDTVIGEEASSTTKDNGRFWAVDPIDGTQPYELGLPLSTIVIALIEQGAVKIAVIYEPISDNMYYAEAGKGAFKNDQPIHCNTFDNIAKNYFATSSHLPTQHISVGGLHDEIEQAKGKVYNFRSFAYGAAKVAEGKLSGTVLGVGRLYDIAAPALLVEEAGGRATNLSGDPLDYRNGSGGILISNGKVHGTLLKYLGLPNIHT